jgi:hypothetical protein
MRVQFRLPFLAAFSLLVLVSPTVLAQEVQSQGQASSATPILMDGNCAHSTGADEALEMFAPEKSWTSANPCFVSCPGGGFIDCSWSWAGDPTFCCWKTSTRCMSYNCNTGAIALSKQCL